MAGKYSSSDITYWEPLLRVIRKAESSNNYDILVRGKQIPGLKNKTIHNAIEIVNPRPEKYMGAYQFNKKTLEGWASSTGLNPQSDLFNIINQDSIAIYLIESIRNGIQWRNNKMSNDDLMINLSQEWAGLPVPKDMVGYNSNPIKKGQSYYNNFNTNKATVTVNEVLGALQQIDPNKVYNITIEEEVSPFNPTPGTLPPPTSIPSNQVINESDYLQYIQE